MKITLKPEVTATHYVIPIPLQTFRSRFVTDEDRTDAHIKAHKPQGIDNIEFNGHFGANVFFSAETDADRDAFVKMLEDFLSIPKAKLRS